MSDSEQEYDDAIIQDPVDDSEAEESDTDESDAEESNAEESEVEEEEPVVKKTKRVKKKKNVVVKGNPPRFVDTAKLRDVVKNLIDVEFPGKAAALEPTIYNLCLRIAKHKGVSPLMTNSAFRSMYASTSYGQIGIFKIVGSCSVVQKEMKNDVHGWESEAFKDERQSMAVDDDLAANPHQIKEDTTNQCGECKKFRVVYYQMQTRSSDEPMTTFFTCLECANTWAI